MDSSNGGPTMVGLPSTRCMCPFPTSLPISGQDCLESRKVTMHILLLTQQQCPSCTQAKEILDRLSAEYSFTLSTLDVSAPEGEALAVRSGVLFPPGIFLDVNVFSYGRLSERMLRNVIERLRKPVRE